MTIRNATALTIQIFFSKVMSLLFNILVRFVIVSLPRYKYLNFMAAVTICSDFGAQEKRKEWERLEISSRKLEILRGDHLTYLLRNLYAGSI